ncbi:MAG: DUF5060 domain-containing protein [Cyclobacteriaceae bacterium]
MRKVTFSNKAILSFYLAYTITYFAQGQTNSTTEQVEQFGRFELELSNDKVYANPFSDVDLHVSLRHASGAKVEILGFYDGDNTWKFRFSPSHVGKWTVDAQFSDQEGVHKFEFVCTPSSRKGRVRKNPLNPYWLTFSNSHQSNFRSFHVGDRFMALNWDDPNDDQDGNNRKAFLDWIEEHDYNMLSIGSLFTNRNEPGRGKGWKTPQLWPLDIEQFNHLENILDDLDRRGIVLFPFAGFFGMAGEWPTKPDEQEDYIKYLTARLGHYGNIIYNLAGPEPFWREEVSQYKGEMRMVDIHRFASLIKKYDVYDHLVTVHNEKRATKYGDPFIYEDWYDMSILQGPTTINREELFSGLSMNHHIRKPAYAQETLWHGNLYHPEYSLDQIRKNAYTMLFAGCIINFADMDGNSSTGFSGTLNLDDVNMTFHDAIKPVWDWFESIPFQTLKPRQDLVKHGFCLAKEHQEYYIYLDTIGEVELFLNTPYDLESEWINAKNVKDVRTGPKVREKTMFESPSDGDDWILHVFAKKPSNIATGNFPDVAIDEQENIHIVYNRNGLKYKKYVASQGIWQEEMDTGCACEMVHRSDPDIVIDSQGNPHVFCGKEYAWLSKKKWIRSIPGGSRDTELAIDGNDNVYLVHRGGYNGGYLGLTIKPKNSQKWIALTDPDVGDTGYNDHVYPDIHIDKNDVIHIVQRHGPEVEVTYRYSQDQGKSWMKSEAVSNDREESPHIVIDANGTPIIATGSGEIWERKNYDWHLIGHKIHCHGRYQPELTVDQSDNVYVASFGGKFNTRYKNAWLNENILRHSEGDSTIGFVEAAGAQDFAYVIWEEGYGNADRGLFDNAKIYIAKLYPDGTLVGF